MQAVNLHPQRRMIVSKQIVLFVLAVLCIAVPALCLPVALCMPLFSCPLIRGKEQWSAYVTAPVPALVALLDKGHPVYALGIALAALLPVAATAILSKEKTGTPVIFYVYAFLCALSGALALYGIYLQSGLWLPELAGAKAVEFVMHHPQRAQLLHQAMLSELLPVPAGYTKVSILSYYLDPIFLRQMMLALESRVVQWVYKLLPMLLINASIILGLFTGLRVQRLRNAFLLVDKDKPGKVCIAMTPPFSQLNLPRKWRWAILAFLLVQLFLGGAEGVWAILSLLLGYTAETLLQLQGAAMVCSWLMKSDPDRRNMAGWVAAALYLLLPIALLVLGCFDNLSAFRRHTEDDNEESDHHKEEKP